MRRERGGEGGASETNSLHRSTSLLTDFCQCSEIDLSLLEENGRNGTTNFHPECSRVAIGFCQPKKLPFTCANLQNWSENWPGLIPPTSLLNGVKISA